MTDKNKWPDPSTVLATCDASLVWRLSGFAGTDLDAPQFLGVSLHPHPKGCLISASDGVVGGMFLDETGTAERPVAVELTKACAKLAAPNEPEPDDPHWDKTLPRFASCEASQPYQPILFVLKDGSISVVTPSGKSAEQSDGVLADTQPVDLLSSLPDADPSGRYTVSADPDYLSLFADCCEERSIHVAPIDGQALLVRTTMPNFVGILAATGMDATGARPLASFKETATPAAVSKKKAKKAA